jgi:hypothetical protein
MQQYTAQARRHCGVALKDVSPGARIITTDTLLVVPIGVPDSAIEETWAAAVRAGVQQLPPRVERNPVIDDVFTYVVELRQGDDYRASEIEHVKDPEAGPDQQVQAVYAVVNRLVPEAQVTKP